MNKENDLCEESKEYSYLSCIYKSIIIKVGCQPQWAEIVETDFQNCNETNQLREFIVILSNSLLIMEDTEMLDTFHCLKPCNYMEYRVKMKL